MSEAALDFEYDYFISRRGEVAEIAVEVCRTLEDAGYKVKVQDHDFGRGGDFVGDIHDALVSARNMFVLHTRDYDQNYWTRKEFTNFLAALGGSHGLRRICVLRCDESAPRGILANVVFGDLVGVSDPERRRTIILDVARGEALRTRSEAPVFGGAMPKKNENFTGRAEVIARIKAELDNAESPTALRLVAISGLPGVGKTSVVRAFIDQFGGDYVGVWWTAADTRSALLTGLAALAARLDARFEGESDLEKAARAALARIERVPRPFLLVFDNVERLSPLEDLLPARGAHLLLTSRRSDWGGHAHEVSVDLMSEDEAAAFIQARAKRKDEAGARRLASALGYLPLALDHAGAYVKLAMTSFDAYAKSIDKLMAKAPKDAPYPASVAATFSLAMDNAVAECAGADAVLGYFAFLAPDRIPLDLVTEAIIAEDERGEALMALADVSLIRSDPIDDETPAVSLHRLVQAAARMRLAARGASTAMLERVVHELAAAFPARAYEEAACWPRCDHLLAHALAVRGHAAAAGLANADLAALYDRVGCFLHGRASLDLAQAVFRDAIAVAQKSYGAEHVEVSNAMNNLANVLHDAGKGGEAEPLLRQALAIQDKTVGREHPSYATALTNLALVLQETGRVAEAEQLLREAIALGEATLGRGHPEVAVRLNNLARLLQLTKRRDEAEELLREAIAHGERDPGREHPAVAVRLNNLAILLVESGRLNDAELLFREAIASGEKALGPDHPDVAGRLNNLANLLRDTGRTGEAETLYRRALAAFERSHTDHHPLTARVRRNFAALLLATGRAEEARREANLALAVHAELLGAGQTWTMDSARTLAEALDALVQPEEAAAVRAKHKLAVPA